MQRGLSFLLVLLAAVVIYLGAHQWRRAAAVGRDDAVYLLLAEHPLLARESADVVRAYLSVLDEEGFPWQRLNMYHLLDMDPVRLAARCRGLVLPEQACATGLTPLTHWLRAFMSAGGEVLLVYDAGSRNEEGRFQTNRGLRELLDLAVTDGDPTDRHRFGRGPVRFVTREAAVGLGVPPGKLNDDRQLCGYGFGALAYPLALVRPQTDAADITVWAWGENAEGSGGPVIVARSFAPGGLLYVGLPLGYLKGQGDDLPLRIVLRHFAGERARLPRIVPAPRGIGGLVLSWHIDGAADLAAVPAMAAAGFLDPALPASWHVCAGPDNDAPGDGGGFDACGRGRPSLDLLPAGSELGSHGGWAHNHFARRLAVDDLPPAELRSLIVKNRDCLAEVAGRSLREYSSPAGVHPQPLLTEIIAELGFTCYYYTGDGGSAPNRTFYGGQPVPGGLIAFPVLPLGGSASLGEIVRDPRLAPADLAGWLDAATDYCAAERTVRLVYAHPYDLFTGPGEAAYREVWLAWQRRLRERQTRADLQVDTMGRFAEFLARCWRTEAVYRRGGDGLRLALRNPEGLRDITIAVPRPGLLPPRDDRVTVAEDADCYFLTIEDAGHALDLLLPAH
ncbi:MAG: hypothetical protein RBT60_09525 [Candidatus Krumholzibacteria bacterium]|jgi:hypothetical protein|nr:hypothetical protein [Candidatus Krumholzibacteria bacterium]